MIDRRKHIWEGWTVGTFIDELEWIFDMIMSGRSHVKKFTTKDEMNEFYDDGLQILDFLRKSREKFW